ncbi:hypothetical protein D9V84_02830 [Bacteroidetes/Chlorobi group bacterium Naka2016]|nr:MAG: hypothetical protein D9V84_02830 [Bacteroidetes/Chlorobi group bacterium Naka2016]
MKRQKLFNYSPLREGQVVLFRNFSFVLFLLLAFMFPLRAWDDSTFVWRKSFHGNMFCSSARNELAQGI